MQAGLPESSAFVLGAAGVSCHFCPSILSAIILA
jgi:hypothetical protein